MVGSGIAAAAGAGLVVRDLGLRPYEQVWAEMQALTDSRAPGAADEIWFVQHPPVFTLGMNADVAHVVAPGDIPLVQTDRGGQVTYHGPGQLVVYVMLDVRRRALGARALVELLESVVVAAIEGYGVEGRVRREAPGVYVDDRKLAAIGLRIRRGCSYHGLAFNVAMDLEPFSRINPCGYEGLEVTQLSELTDAADIGRVRRDMERELRRRLE